MVNRGFHLFVMPEARSFSMYKSTNVRYEKHGEVSTRAIDIFLECSINWEEWSAGGRARFTPGCDDPVAPQGPGYKEGDAGFEGKVNLLIHGFTDIQLVINGSDFPFPRMDWEKLRPAIRRDQENFFFQIRIPITRPSAELLEAACPEDIDKVQVTLSLKAAVMVGEPDEDEGEEE